MPTELGRKYLTTWRGRPPHMQTTDHPVWYRFLDRYGKYFKALYYDCLLGGPFLTEEQYKDSMLRMWRFNTSKRADAIAELEDEVWIIEVADYPGLRAVGQLNVYQTLWIEDIKDQEAGKADTCIGAHGPGPCRVLREIRYSDLSSVKPTPRKAKGGDFANRFAGSPPPQGRNHT